MTPEERRERHILVVDDDDRLRKLIKEFLGRAGFRVTAASNAAARLLNLVPHGATYLRRMREVVSPSPRFDCATLQPSLAEPDHSRRSVSSAANTSQNFSSRAAGTLPTPSPSGASPPPRPPSGWVSLPVSSDNSSRRC